MMKRALSKHNNNTKYALCELHPALKNKFLRIKNLIYIFSFLFLLSACGGKEKKVSEKQTTPTVSNNGKTISFSDSETISFFKTEKVSNANIGAELKAPAKIAATILPSDEGASQNIVLFDNSDLSVNYTQLLQHQINISQIQNINIKQKTIELERIKDMQSHGAATGQDLLNAQSALSIEQTNLANEKTALIEHETKLKAGGFNPEILRKAEIGTVFIICDIPENRISKIRAGQSCDIIFTAFPEKIFKGKVNAIADLVDNTTRMVKVRITLKNTNNQLKSGMFANVSFEVSESDFISISNSSIITVQGKDYVFVKKSANEFERREIRTGQQIGDRIIVFNGIENGDEIAIEGVMQLKGLSFGY